MYAIIGIIVLLVMVFGGFMLSGHARRVFGLLASRAAGDC